VLLGIAGVLIAIGVGYLIVSYGLLKGKGWAWSITLILSYIGIALGVASIISGNFLSIIHLIINIAVIYYLYRTHVKTFFGKSVTAKI
jgi:uncharacterized membrane protein (DUF2068 family)